MHTSGSFGDVEFFKGTTMADTFSQTTNQSWFSRIGNAIKGILLGIVLIVIAFPVLFWNEGRAVTRARDLTQGEKTCVTIDAAKTDKANDGKLVYISADAKASEAVEDDLTKVSASALCLKRQVEMYQWKESKSESTKKNVGGSTSTTTTYSYDKVWSTNLENSQGFKDAATHQNPGAMAVTSSQFNPGKVTMGAFTVPASMVQKLPASQGVPITDTAVAALPADLKATAKVTSGTLYIGKDAAAPAIGDLKITYHAIPAGPVSLVARQVGASFEPYTSSSGGSIELIQAGTVSAGALFQQAQAENTRLTWILRGVGFLMFLFGFVLLLKPLSVLADVIPFLGGLVGAGSFVIGLCMAVIFSTITIALGWLVYRPLTGILLLIVAAAAIFAAFRYLHKRKPAPAPAAAA
jgi:hypothetical protein